MCFGWNCEICEQAAGRGSETQVGKNSATILTQHLNTFSKNIFFFGLRHYSPATSGSIGYYG